MSFVIRKLFPETEEKKGTEGALIETAAVKAEKKNKPAAATGTEKTRKARAKPRKRVVRSEGGKSVSASGTKKKNAKAGAAKKSAKDGKKLSGNAKTGKNSPSKRKTPRGG